MNNRTLLHGVFASDCSLHVNNAKPYCKGTCTITLQGDHIENNGRGTIQIDYDTDSQYQPPMLIPRPLPSMPVRVELIKAEKQLYKLLVETTWMKPWQKVFDLIGMSVTFYVAANEITGTYNVKGGLGIPKDAGWIRVDLST